MSTPTFTDLEVYKECRLLRKEISALVKTHFPNEEKFKLTDQIIRSSRGVTASLAEGHGRYHLPRKYSILSNIKRFALGDVGTSNYCF